MYIVTIKNLNVFLFGFQELSPREVALHHLAERTHPLIFEKKYFGNVKGNYIFKHLNLK